MQAWQQDPPDRLEAGSAKRRRGLFDLAADFLHDRLDGAHHEGQADEDQRDDDARPRERDADTERRQQAADPAIRRIDRGKRDAGHCRRQSEGNIDDCIDEAASRKAIAHQYPGEDDAKDHIDQRRNEGGAETRFKRFQRALVGDEAPEAEKSDFGGTQHQGRKRMRRVR